MRDSDDPIIVEHELEAPVETVWRSITMIDLMRQWYFGNIPDFRPEVGFETEFNVRSQDRDFLHLWKVTEVEPLRKIAYDWRYDGYRGSSSVVFELFKKDSGTLLRLTVLIWESFPEDIPEFTRESCIAGWKFFIGKRLKGFLEKI